MERAISSEIPDGKEKESFEAEAAQIFARRKVVLEEAGKARPWALAISGGGIRSATFGFGVMQALATVDVRSMAPAPVKSKIKSLLRRFDYISTVSGGGYIGAFFCSLFVPDRLRDPSTSEQAADDAYETMATVPPHRLRTEDMFDPKDVGHCPTAWLRENGRYLTPTGSGDYLYVAAIGVRNWFALQYVLATLLLVVFSLLGLARSLLAASMPEYATKVESLFLATPASIAPAVVGQGPSAPAGIPWSPVWWLVLAALFLWIAPSCLAFWLAYPRKGESDVVPTNRVGWAVVFTSVAGFALAWGWWLDSGSNVQSLRYTLQLGGILVAFGLGFRLFCAFGKGKVISGYRVIVSRATAKGIAWLLVLSLVAAADTAGLALYQMNGALHKFSLPVIAAAAAWVVRKAAGLFDGTKGPTSMLKQIPLGAIMSVAAVILLLLVATTWDLVVQLLTWSGPATLPQLQGESHRVALEIVLGISALLALVAGLFPGFINLSTLSSFYSSRLTRAYLGASNGERFRTKSARSAAEPLPSDQLSLDKYYSPSLAPVHLINVTVNQTVDPTEQLIQRDRKGRPLVVTPTGFFIDGEYLKRQLQVGDPKVPGGTRDDCNHTDAKAEDEKEVERHSRHTKQRPSESLSLGQWIGASGAAVSTGLGRSTSFGASLGLGLANVRLGVWWSSGRGANKSLLLEWLFQKVLRTQAYLLYELLARFYGLHRELQYLTDGGHFENTGIYELLRSAREVQLIVACDDGCDRNYQFEDLANLVRLARIDFGLDIQVDQAILQTKGLCEVFGDFKDFGSSAPASNKCAILLEVCDSKNCDVVRVPLCRIILLKPILVKAASVDIINYQNTHADFPQESTANQFFDEAQWESYRDLGYRIGHLVFGCTQQGGNGSALWQYLNMPTAFRDSNPEPLPAG